MCHRSIGLSRSYHHQVHHIRRATHSHCNKATDTLPGSGVWHCCQIVCSPKSSLRWSLKRTKSSITPSRSTGLAECATRMSSWFNRDWPVVRQLTQQHAKRSLAFNTHDGAGQVDSCKQTNIFEYYVQFFLLNITYSLLRTSDTFLWSSRVLVAVKWITERLQLSNQTRSRSTTVPCT